MKILVIGAGYVGLVTASCIANLGFNVICVDKSKDKINKLNNNILPIYEFGLYDIIRNNKSKHRLTFSTEISKYIKEADVIFIAVGTPQYKNGNVNLNQIKSVAKTIGENINNHKIIITKSTVPVGTYKIIRNIINNNIKDINLKNNFDMISNPEFLRQGTAVSDFNNPDRIIIGYENKDSLEVIRKIYLKFINKKIPIIETNIETAELIKYSANAFLAMKISFINDLSKLCEKTQANIMDISKALGLDNRISNKFLSCGPGFGGSCFPKDTLGLINIGKQNDIDLKLIKATVDINNNQKLHCVNKILKEFKNIENKKIAILGLSFKPETDDLRESPSISIIKKLIKNNFDINVYDPIAIENTKAILKDSVNYYDNIYSTLEDVKAVAIITDWDIFKFLDLEKIKNKMEGNLFFDFRNLYNKNEIEKFNLIYHGTGVN